MTAIRRVAILEDDEDQSFVLCKWFREAGFEPTAFAAGRVLIDFLKKETVDLVIVDWQLPDMPGVEVVRVLREELNLVMPIVIATSRNLEEDIVEGLNAGADDYVVKPLRHAEVIARAESIIRRVKARDLEISSLQSITTYSAYQLELASRSVSFNQQKVVLRDKEFQFATMLFEHSEKIAAGATHEGAQPPAQELSRREIHEHIWTTIPYGISTRTIDTHAYRLRVKLELDGRHGYALKAVRGQGYRLEKTVAGAVIAEDAAGK